MTLATLDVRSKVSLTRSIHLAASCGDIQSLKELFAAGGDINARNKRGLNALYYAINKEKHVAAAWLVRHGIDIHAVFPKTGNMALHYALHRVAAKEVLLRLLARGARIDDLRICGAVSIKYAPLLAAVGFEWHEGRERCIQTTSKHEFQAAVDRAINVVGGRRFVIVRVRMLEICVALQYLRLPALVTALILEESFLYGKLVPCHLTWQLATAVKHFRDKKDA